MRDYLAGFDLYHMSQGNDYAVRNAWAKPIAQNAEQDFHDFAVGYHAARGRPGRPAWALEPLPGLERVVVAAPAPRAIARLPARRARMAQPISSASASSSTPSRVASRIRDEIIDRTPSASASSSTPTRVASRANYHHHGETLPQLQTPQKKRKSSEIIDISSSSDEDEVAQPARKKPRFPSVVVVDPDVIDLTV